MASRTLITSVEQLDKYIPIWYGRPFAFDVETSGTDYVHSWLAGLALTFEGNESFYITFKHSVPIDKQVTKTIVEKVIGGYITEEYFTPAKKIRKTREVPQYVDLEQVVTEQQTIYPFVDFIMYEEFTERLRGLFAQPNVLMVAHNAKFDMHFIRRENIEIEGRLADTMLAAQLINENRDLGLKDLAPLIDMELTHYQDLEHHAGFHKNDYVGVPLGIASNYAMMDTEATLALWGLFRQQLADKKLGDVFANHWMPLLRTLQKMESTGIALNLEQVAKIRDTYVKEEAINADLIWHEGIKMVIDRFWRNSASELPPSFYRMATADEIENKHGIENEYGDGAYAVTVKQVSVPMFKPSERSAWRVLDFKVGSNDHVGDLLYDWLGLSPPTMVKLNKTANGRSVDKNTLKVISLSLADKCPPLVNTIIERRQQEKFITTYLDNFLKLATNDPEHAIRTSFNQAVTDTGRLSSSNPVNLQNIPSRGQRGKEARDMFIAREGMQLIVADYGMMELRMAAHFAAKLDPNHSMIRAFNAGQDLHMLTASKQFSIPYDELALLVGKKDVDATLKRTIGKTSNFGLLYGMGANKFQTYLWTEVGLYLNIKEVAALIDGFNSTFQTVTDWKGLVSTHVHKVGYAKSITGRFRHLPEIYSSDRYEVMRAERQAINYIVQGSCADIINEALPAVDAGIRPFGGRVLLQVHDELVAEAPTIYAQACARIMETYMTQLSAHRLRCPMVADAHIGLTWGSAKL